LGEKEDERRKEGKAKNFPPECYQLGEVNSRKKRKGEIKKREDKDGEDDEKNDFALNGSEQNFY